MGGGGGRGERKRERVGKERYNKYILLTGMVLVDIIF